MVYMNQLVLILIFCVICCPCLTALFCIICCFLTLGVYEIKEKLFKRRREPMNPNVRNNRNYSIDLEEASINNTIDDNVSNNHRPSKLMQILQKQ